MSNSGGDCDAPKEKGKLASEITKEIEDPPCRKTYYPKRGEDPIGGSGP